MKRDDSDIQATLALSMRQDHSLPAGTVQPSYPFSSSHTEARMEARKGHLRSR